jgi:hypothetical protein
LRQGGNQRQTSLAALPHHGIQRNPIAASCRLISLQSIENKGKISLARPLLNVWQANQIATGKGSGP